MSDSRPLRTTRNPAVLLLGPTGAGKTPLGEMIEARGLWGMSCLHFDFGANLRAVVMLECSEATVRRRIEGNVGGDRHGRTDDDPAAVRTKLDLFQKRTAPLVDDYRQRGIRIEHLTVGPATTAEEAWRALDARPPGPSPDRVPRSGQK